MGLKRNRVLFEYLLAASDCINELNQHVFPQFGIVHKFFGKNDTVSFDWFCLAYHFCKVHLMNPYITFVPIIFYITLVCLLRCFLVVVFFLL